MAVMHTRERMRVLTTRGQRWMQLDDGAASVVARHWNEVRRFLETGDEQPLLDFSQYLIDEQHLETDPMVIYALGHRGELNFDDLYGEGGEW